MSTNPYTHTRMLTTRWGNHENRKGNSHQLYLLTSLWSRPGGRGDPGCSHGAPHAVARSHVYRQVAASTAQWSQAYSPAPTVLVVKRVMSFQASWSEKTPESTEARSVHLLPIQNKSMNR
jgi:hypothetical protein